jgi:hypothetical protein
MEISPELTDTGKQQIFCICFISIRNKYSQFRSLSELEVGDNVARCYTLEALMDNSEMTEACQKCIRYHIKVLIYSVNAPV